MEAVAAYTRRQRVLGMKNKLPWHLPEDLRFFKALTRHHTVLMGRKTYESIGKPLPERRNIILTRNIHYQAPGCEIIHSLEALSQLVSATDRVIVIGGAEIYEMCLPYCVKVWATEIELDVEGDAFFPYLNRLFWRPLGRVVRLDEATQSILFSWVAYERIRAETR
jgi:dihydrofolate reductase